MPGDIWVLVEHADGAVRKVSIELLSAASGFVTKTGGSVGAALLGGDTESVVKSVLPYADRVYMVKDNRLATYTSDGYTSVLTSLVKTHAPSILLAGSTSMGRDLFPRLAMRLDTGLASDCTDLDIAEGGRLLATRPIYGGKVFAQVSFSGSSPQMATVRPNAFSVEKVGRGGRVIQTELPGLEADTRQTVEGMEKTAQRKADITEAQVVIGVGRGIGDPKNFGIVQELADVLGATVGVTRSVVDNGWWDVNDQIGKSGKNISARLYFAVALSGAVHHVLGIQTCGTVVAVNKDPNALIFNYADYGLVGDVMEVIPALKEEIARVKKEL